MFSQLSDGKCNLLNPHLLVISNKSELSRFHGCISGCAFITVHFINLYRQQRNYVIRCHKVLMDGTSRAGSLTVEARRRGTRSEHMLLTAHMEIV